MNERLKTVALSEMVGSERSGSRGWRGAVILWAALESVLLIGVAWVLYAKLQ